MQRRVSRRSFLQALGASVATTSLTACSSPSAQAPSSQPSAPPATSAASFAATAVAAPTAQPAATPSLAAAAQFPAGFLWGAATSAYQIEGAATEDGRGELVWDHFSGQPGTTQQGATGAVASDHYHRLTADLDLMAQLGLKAYRFSVSWTRILPTGAGAVNQKGLDFYKRLVDGLRQRDIQPLATLFHWDFPQALEERGGWLQRDSAARFAEYASIMFRALGDQVPVWLTLNEPKTVVALGYQLGLHAPGHRDLGDSYRALHHMLLGHGLAVQAFRAEHLPATQQIGIALNLSPVYSEQRSPSAQAAIKLQDGLENRLYLDPVLRGAYPTDVLAVMAKHSAITDYMQPGDAQIIGAPIDVLGVNYYNPTYVKAGPQVVPGPHPTTAASWATIYPEGLYDLLVRIKADYGDIPLYITENGAAYDDELTPDRQVNDQPRLQFLYDHFGAAQRAITAGVALKGYTVWSLLDNFEWAEGYTQRWGLVYVDYASQERILKRSAQWYQTVIKSNAVQPILRASASAA